MGTVKLTGLMGLLLATQALGQSNVAFTPELGGDNHYLRIKQGYPWDRDGSANLLPGQLFTSGSTDTGQLFTIGQDVTWGVRVAVTGTQASGNGAGEMACGAANIVFDLYLYRGSTPIKVTGANWTNSSKYIVKAGAFTSYAWQAGDQFRITAGTGIAVNPPLYATVAAKINNDTIQLASDINGTAGDITDSSINLAGPMATGAAFHSTINDGLDGAISASAAFTYAFDFVHNGPGRVVDPMQGLAPGSLMGGPLCGGVDNTRPYKVKSATYPTPPPNTGTILGMGAGYNLWSGGGGGASQTVPGLGVDKNTVLAFVTSPGPPKVYNTSVKGLGNDKPLCEGQINTSALAAGTYCLEIAPPLDATGKPKGINVMRGDINLSAVQNAFATPADSATGGSIQFVLSPCPGVAKNPTPADGATNVALTPTLSWTAAGGATSHDVYFGTSNPPPFIANQAGTSYAPGTLLGNTTYYWRIDEENGCGTPTPGPVWHFTTVLPLTITAWRSVRCDGSYNELEPSVLLNPAAVKSESRSGGVFTIAVNFTRPCDLNPTGGNPYFTDSNGTQMLVQTGSPQAGDESIWYLDLPVTSENGMCYTLHLNDFFMAKDGSGFTVTGPQDCSVRALLGDTTGNGVVNLGDVIYVNSALGQPASVNPALDVDRNGTINAADRAAAKAALGSTGNTCQ